jgi:hypothetical protein
MARRPDEARPPDFHADNKVFREWMELWQERFFRIKIRCRAIPAGLSPCEADADAVNSRQFAHCRTPKAR